MGVPISSRCETQGLLAFGATIPVTFCIGRASNQASALHCYLDVNEAANFDALFSGTDIHHRKDELRENNKYHVMKFDFSVGISNVDKVALTTKFDKH